MRYHPRGPLPSLQAFAMTNSQSLHNIPVGLPRVLIIEDEPLIVELIEDMVCELGYIVSGNARTVSAARQELAKRNFDTVLLDIGLDGSHSPEIADLLLEMRIPFPLAITIPSRRGTSVCPYCASHSHQLSCAPFWKRWLDHQGRVTKWLRHAYRDRPFFAHSRCGRLAPG